MDRKEDLAITFLRVFDRRGLSSTTQNGALSGLCDVGSITHEYRPPAYVLPAYITYWSRASFWFCLYLSQGLSFVCCILSSSSWAPGTQPLSLFVGNITRNAELDNSSYKAAGCQAKKVHSPSKRRPCRWC